MDDIGFKLFDVFKNWFLVFRDDNQYFLGSIADEIKNLMEGLEVNFSWATEPCIEGDADIIDLRVEAHFGLSNVMDGINLGNHRT